MDERYVDLKKKNIELENLQEEYNNIKKNYEEKIKDLKEKKRKLIEMIDENRQNSINYLRSNGNYNNVDMVYLENANKINKQFRINEDEYESRIKRLKMDIEENYKDSK